MVQFKKNKSLTGKFKDIVSTGNNLVDAETGEAIDFYGILHDVYGDASFDISVSYKEDSEVEPGGVD